MRRSKVDLDKLQVMAANGWTITKAAAEFGVSKQRVHQIARQRGIKMNDGRSRLTSEIRDQIADMARS